MLTAAKCITGRFMPQDNLPQSQPIERELPSRIQCRTQELSALVKPARFVCLVSIVATLIGFASCGGTATPAASVLSPSGTNDGPGGGLNSPTAAFVMAAEITFSGTTDTYGDFAIYRFDSVTATLTRLGTSGQNAVPGPLALHPNARWVYAGGGVPGPDVDSPLGEAFSVDASGQLAPIPGSPFWAGDNANALVVHPSGKFVYYDQVGGAVPGYNGLLGFSIGANGEPAAQVPKPLPALSAAGMVFSPGGDFLYLVGRSASATNIFVFAVDASSGALSQLAVTPVSASGNIESLGLPQMTPSGDYLYVATDSSVAGFRRDLQNGELTPIGNWPVTQGAQLASFVLSADGRFLYTAECFLVPQLDGSGCAQQSALRTYSVGAGGQLLPAFASQPIPQTGRVVALATSGKFVFLGTSTPMLTSGNDGYQFNGTISAFAVEPGTGVLTLKGSVTGPGGPTFLLPIPGQ